MKDQSDYSTHAQSELDRKIALKEWLYEGLIRKKKESAKIKIDILNIQIEIGELESTIYGM